VPSTRTFSRRALRALLSLGGVVATTAGLDTVIRGARSLPGQNLANAAVESELRFYAAFYVAYGIAVLRVAPKADSETRAVRSLAGALFLAGVGRAAASFAAGRPHELQRALLVVELAAPPLIVSWQARLAANGGRHSYGD
jgi:hypothetical protein